MWRKSGLRTKLVMAFLAVMLIPVLEISAYGYFFTNQELARQALDRSMQEVYLQAEHIVTALTQAHGDILYMAQLRSLRTMRDAGTTEAQDVWRSETEQDLLVLLSVRPMYHSMRFMDDSGQELLHVVSDGQTVRAKPASELRSYAELPYFRETSARGGVYVSSFAQDGDTPIIHYCLKVQGGVLVIDLHVGWILRNLPHEISVDSWALVDQDGYYLAYPETYIPPVSSGGRSLISADLTPLLTGASGTFEAGDNVYIYQRVMPSSSTPERYWALYRSTPQSVFYASVTDFYSRGALFVEAALVVAVVLALVISQSIVKPILDLERKAAAFGRGAPAPVLPEQLPADEIGELTRTFYQMAQELEGKRHELKTLVDRLITAQEEERKLVAFDLHDGLIQQMVGARFYLTTYRSTCPPGDTGHGLARGCDALSEAIAEGRRIIEGLRPSALDDLGLMPALGELAQTTAEAAGWKLALDLHALTVEPDKSISVTLYRIAQEALNNVRKHAQASAVELSCRNGLGIELTIADNGTGFDPASVRMRRDGYGFGITTMRERAELLGGTCHIVSTPGVGTRIHVCIPTARVQGRTPEQEELEGYERDYERA